jgi:hypothetical protein
VSLSATATLKVALSPFSAVPGQLLLRGEVNAVPPAAMERFAALTPEALLFCFSAEH